MPDTDVHTPSRIAPGPLLAAAVVIAALVALALLDHDSAPAARLKPRADGPAVTLRPPAPGSDAAASQYGHGLRGSALRDTRH
jgi:hypothetical protein